MKIDYMNALCGRLALFWGVLLILIAPSLAVKPYLFKKCDQSGFCTRNRHYAQEISKQEHYESIYAIDISTFSVDDSRGQLNATILKRLNDGSDVPLLLTVSVLENDDLRVEIDEKDRRSAGNVDIVNPKRYNEASKWAFVDEPGYKHFTHALDTESMTLTYGEKDSHYEAKIDIYPFKITVYLNGSPELILNDRSFLNIEHFRTKEEQTLENSIHIQPEESTFNDFEDSFKDSKKDTIPMGPESVALDFTMVGYTHVFGIPEHADSLSLKDTTDSDPYRLYNVDIFEYETQSKLPMYGSIPFMIGLKPDSSSAIFFINSADTYVDIKKTRKDLSSNEQQIIQTGSDDKVQSHWMSENGKIDVVLMVKKTIQEISYSYGKLTGFTQLPSLFSVGYHQCRWNYNDEEDVLGVTEKMDESLIPYDTIWLDIEYTENKKYFTWKKEAFSDPQRMLKKLDATGRNLVAIIDPHIKTDYEVSNAIQKQDIGIRNSDGKGTYHGHCWPGESVWIDSLNPESQKYWSKMHNNNSALMGDAQNIYIWNDMNEPSVFNGPETTAPKDLIHYGNWEHRSVHNLYGHSFINMTYQSLIDRNPNRRPFILTRSFFSGSQRYAAMWTGDNMAKWEYLREAIPMVLTMNMVGFPFAGADVGGFFGNPDKELLTRWYQAGIWYPFFRAHAHIDSRRREPYMIGDPHTSIMRDAVKIRYSLLPLLYTNFQKSSTSGLPIMKPVFYENNQEVAAYDIDDEFFVGPLLIKPVTEEGKDTVDVYFPNDEVFYDFNTFEKIQGKGYHNGLSAPLERIPVFIQGGSVFPMKTRYRRSSKLMMHDPYTLIVAVDSQGKMATGELYIDDGESFGYKTNEDYINLNFSYENGKLKCSIAQGGQGEFIDSLEKVKVERIVILGSGKSAEKALISEGDNKWEAEVVKSKGAEDKHAIDALVIRNPKVSITKEWEISI